MKKLFFLLSLFSTLAYSQSGEFMASKKVDFDKTDTEKLKNFRLREDKFENTVFIHHKNSSSDNNISAYIVIEGDNAFLRFRTSYSGSTWIFYNKIILNIDGKNYTHIVSDVKRESHSGGNVTERSDVQVDKEIYFFLEEIYKSTTDVGLRFKGDGKMKDVKISKKIIENLRETLDLYKKL
jgi:hypothetical protein